MKIKISYIICFGASLFLTGCTCSRVEKTGSLKNNTIKSFYTDKPIIVDGVLNDPIWQNATTYPLYLSDDKTNEGQNLKEAGKVRFAWDVNCFYVAASFEDSDIIAEGKDDQMHHYRHGDVCELFLKPVNKNYYWELYVTPANKKTTFFFKQKGASDFENYSCGLKVAANCLGTINNSEDKDKGWTAEMAMPIKDIESRGCKFEQGVKWTILVGRYNYSRYLPDTELSMTPQLSKTNYHLLDEYADLKLVR